MKHIFILNTRAGECNFDLQNKLARVCSLMGLDYQLVGTNSVDTMREYVQRFKNEDAIIYAVGGDGSVNFVLNELVGGKASLGIIPFGSGNDFYRKLNENTKDIVDTNVMKVNERYGINIFSVGIDAEICANAEKMKRLNLPSSMIYNASILYTLFKHKNEGIGINHFYERLMLLAVCNGTYYGGGYAMAKEANIETPDVRIYTVDDMKKYQMPLFFMELLKGCHEDNPHVSVYEADKTIFIEGMRPLVGQLDGEVMEKQFYQIEPHASQIKVVNHRELIRNLKKK